jgi:thiol-disulfide isomerase/thioredoxin
LERPFSRLATHTPKGSGSGFLLGLGLGAVFVPCAGPVLTAIVVVGATKHVTAFSVALTICFAVGATLPILTIALAGERVVERNQKLKQRARILRPIGGVLLIAMAIGIHFNLANDLQKWLPGYTSALQKSVEGNSFVISHLRSLEVAKSSDGQLAHCVASDTKLEMCGKAPNFTGVTAWLNTPHDAPLTIQSLRKKVVLVDFWTYSCINCERSLPHVEAWYKRYHADGLEIVGVHSPEFAFEHVVSNVKTAARQLGVHYPIAVDNNLSTWNAYLNEYWPADYLIDAQGVVRYESFGEGGYQQTENYIRTLLHDANPKVQLPPPTNVANNEPTSPTSPESYLGYKYLGDYYGDFSPVENRTVTYQLANPLPEGEWGLNGPWKVGPEAATAQAQASLSINFFATHVYLVMGGSGTVKETLNGKTLKTFTVSGVPRLYTLVNEKVPSTGLLRLDVSSGVQAYDFTFG